MCTLGLVAQAYGGGRQSLGSAARRSDSHGDGARRRRAAHQALDRSLDQQVRAAAATAAAISIL